MPHFVRVQSIKPLTFAVTEYEPASTGIGPGIQFTRTSVPIHTQPILVRLSDQSIWLMRFEKDGSYDSSVLLVQGAGVGGIPEEFHMVPIHHIPRSTVAMEKLEKLRVNRQSISQYA